MAPQRLSSPASDPGLSLAENVVLALVETGCTHGWAVVRELASDADLGRVWHLSRALTYRAIDTLAEKGLLRRKPADGAGGRERVPLVPTAAGRRAFRLWVDVPVGHVREVRTELLVKLVLRERAGLDNHELLVRQRDQLAPLLDALTHRVDGDDLVAAWRAENAGAVRRFLDRAIGADRVGASTAGELTLSARNQLRGTVASVRRGDVLSSVRVALRDGQEITAVITTDAVDDLDLVRGDDAVVVMKSTEVMIATPPAG